MTTTTRFGAKSRRALAGAAVLALTAGVGVVAAVPASAAPVAVNDATFRWGLSGEAGSAAFLPGSCNFLSAGTAGNSGSSRLWTSSDIGTLYKATDGNTRIVKPNAVGADTTPSFATKCQDRNGAAITLASYTGTGNQVVIDDGVGTIDVTANTADIQWTGSFTSVAYSGLSYWTAVNPRLVVSGNGTATVTATATGYAADRNDTSKWIQLADTPVTLANLTGVTVTANGFLSTPKYLGTSVTVGSGSTPQVKTGAFWGAFPQSFVDFQEVAGSSAYWYSSGGARDQAKVASQLVIGIGSTPVTAAVPTGVTLTASTTRSVVGASVRLTATVSPASAAGVVTFKDGSRNLVNVRVVSGRAILDTRVLTVNPHSLRAVFTPSAPIAYSASTSTPKSLTVVKAKSTAKVKLAKSKIKKSKKASVTVTVTLAGTPLKANGKVTIKLGKKTVKTGTVKNGKVKLTLPKQKKGTYKVKAVYSGNGNAVGSTSKTVTLRVTK